MNIPNSGQIPATIKHGEYKSGNYKPGTILIKMTYDQYGNTTQTQEIVKK